MSRLFLVRHGPTHAKTMVGWSDLPADLSDTAALARLSDHLPSHPFWRIKSSALLSAQISDRRIQKPFRNRHKASLSAGFPKHQIAIQTQIVFSNSWFATTQKSDLRRYQPRIIRKFPSDSNHRFRMVLTIPNTR